MTKVVGFDDFAAMASGGSFPEEARHEDIKVAEELREMSAAQYAKVLILRTEQAIRRRDGYLETTSEFYKKLINDFSYWQTMTWSAALFHPYHLESESTTPLYVRDFLEVSDDKFSDIQPVMESEDADRIFQLGKEYKTWVIRKLESYDGG